MNCKPGDLAVIVGSLAGNEGKVVRCLRLYSQRDVISEDGFLLYGPLWCTDVPVRHVSGAFRNFASDRNLRPLRDPGDDARDETLAWKPVPHWGEALVESARKVAENIERLA